MKGWHDEVDAVVEAWLPGQAGGGAIADVLTGRVNPSGRLAETIPLRLNDTPCFLNFPGEQAHVRYGEGVMVGYRYYETADVAVRYPFGHGLSYTSFEQTDFRVTPTGPDTATVSVTVTNTGDRSGKHVVQVYVAAPERPVSSPARELRGFTKVALAPGESATVEIDLDRRAFAYWDVTRGDWAVTAGQYQVQLADNAHDVVATAALDLAGDNLPQSLTLDSTASEWFGHPTVGPALTAAMTSGLTEEQSDAVMEENAGALSPVALRAPRRSRREGGPARGRGVAGQGAGDTAPRGDVSLRRGSRALARTFAGPGTAGQAPRQAAGVAQGRGLPRGPLLGVASAQGTGRASSQRARCRVTPRSPSCGPAPRGAGGCGVPSLKGLILPMRRLGGGGAWREREFALFRKAVIAWHGGRWARHAGLCS